MATLRVWHLLANIATVGRHTRRTNAGHRAALARTMRYISGAGRHGLSYTRQSGGFTLTGYCDASYGREMYRTAPGFCKS